MSYSYCVQTDIGTTRDSNQDSAYANTVKTSIGNAFMGVVCDGMGGLSNGELASVTVSELFQKWFINDFARDIPPLNISDYIFGQWKTLIDKANATLMEISKRSGGQMGTTLSVLLIVNNEYYAAQVGDSRIYRRSNECVSQITCDHSYVMDQVKKGMMTETEARLSSKRNILTRCIGAVEAINGDFYNGTVQNGDCFLISSDGFHGGASIYEIGEILEALNSRKHNKVKKTLSNYIDLRKNAGEKDNITAVVVMI